MSLASVSQNTSKYKLFQKTKLFPDGHLMRNPINQVHIG